MDARGQLGKAIVFGGWKGIPWVREWFIPQNPQSDAQDVIRLIFSQAVERYQQLGDPNHASWEVAVGHSGKTMSGFNFFVSEYINSMRAGETPSDTPPAHLL